MKAATIRAAALGLAVAAACTSSEGGTQPPETTCRVLRASEAIAAELHESSGVALSRHVPAVLWTHNDGGNGPWLYATDADGMVLTRTRVSGAENVDWEDLAAGPCPSGDCLYVADTGDNQGTRDEVVLYRIPEPSPDDTMTAPAERFTLRYPAGEHDAEAMFVLPNGDVFLVTKGRHGPIGLFRAPAPLRPGASIVLEPVRQVSAGAVGRGEQVTAAAATPDGRWVAVRTYESLFLYRTPDLLAGRDTAAARADLRMLAEPQGEAVALRSDGVVVLTSEGGKTHVPATLARLACTLPRYP